MYLIPFILIKKNFSIHDMSQIPIKKEVVCNFLNLIQQYSMPNNITLYLNYFLYLIQMFRKIPTTTHHHHLVLHILFNNTPSRLTTIIRWDICRLFTPLSVFVFFTKTLFNKTHPLIIYPTYTPNNSVLFYFLFLNPEYICYMRDDVFWAQSLPLVLLLDCYVCILSHHK